MICECYRDEKNFLGKFGTCWGTAERDACSCGGDKSKCDFYPNVREEEKKPITNADRIRAMTDEELAEFLYDGCCREGEAFPCSDVGCKKCWLEWLKQEASDG
jgi:hypothetical protein